MNPTAKQLKDWRTRENLTLKQAAEVCGIKNFSRHVSGQNPQPLPAPNWFRACTYSLFKGSVYCEPPSDWIRLGVLVLDLNLLPECSGLSTAALTVVAAHKLLSNSELETIREEMKK